MSSNELYLTVLPIIHLGRAEFGRTEETLTLFPDEKFATEFFADEVEGYIATFQNRLKYLTGGHVKGYDVQRVPKPDGRVIVKVIQNVSAT
jgi:hypothetical protein